MTRLRNTRHGWKRSHRGVPWPWLCPANGAAALTLNDHRTNLRVENDSIHALSDRVTNMERKGQ